MTKMAILITDGKSHLAAETETEAEGARNDDNILRCSPCRVGSPHVYATQWWAQLTKKLASITANPLTEKLASITLKR